MMLDGRMGHPGFDELLRWADGELDVRAADGIREHVAGCADCQAEVERIEAVRTEHALYQEFLKQECMPPPPAPWFEPYREFARIDSGRGQVVVMPPRRRLASWAASAAAVLTVGVLLQQFVFTESVKAAELLQKASAAEQLRPAGLRRIEIRTKSERFARPVGFSQSAAPHQAAAGLESMFRAARYSWEDPLSAKSFMEWRNGLPEKQDEVAEFAGQGGSKEQFYRISTRTQSGELAAASLTLRASDWRAVQGRLEFRNQETVDIAELPLFPAPAAGTAVSTARAEAGLRPSAGSAAAPEEATVSDELQVLAALHRVEADVDDPVEIARARGSVLVTGVGVAKPRQEEIQRALAGLPHVVVRFPDGGSPNTGEAKSQAVDTGKTVPERLERRLEAKAGGKAEFTLMADRTLAASERLVARAHALRRLADRFPAAAEAKLSAADRATLAGLRKGHWSDIEQAAAAIRQETATVLPAISTGTAEPSGSWQAASTDALRTAKECDHLLGALLAGAPAEGEVSQMPARTSACLSSLASRLQANHTIF